MTAALMGTSTRQQIEDFWQLVQDWIELPLTFAWTRTEPSICLGNRVLLRESLIGRYPWEAYQEVLHETAHAIKGGGHGREFHDTLADLIRWFLGTNSGVEA